MKDSKYFNINDTDINKIRVSEAKVFTKENKSYKHHIFYEDGDEYIPLNICFSKTLGGYYNDKEYEDGNVSKSMNFVIDDDGLINRINDIFEHIEEKLDTVLQDPIYKSEINHCLRTKTYKRTRLNKEGCKNIHIVPNKNIKYEWKPLLQIQAIYYAQEDKKVIFYYPQIRLEQCGYKDFIEYNIAQKDFMFTDSEPEWEEEFNDDNDRDEQSYFNVLIIT